jgi:Ca2+-binding EF-hand superfamily protein
MLDLLWIKLDERFSSMSHAFRYFDKNYNNRVSFGEFQKALDNLRIKYQVEMIDQIF